MIIILKFFLVSIIFNLILLPHLFSKISNENNLKTHLQVILLSILLNVVINIALIIIYIGLLKYILSGPSEEYWKHLKALYYKVEKDI